MTSCSIGDQSDDQSDQPIFCRSIVFYRPPDTDLNYLKEFKKTHQLIQNNKKFGQSFAFIVSTFFILIGRPAQPQTTILFTAALQFQTLLLVHFKKLAVIFNSMLVS